MRWSLTEATTQLNCWKLELPHQTAEFKYNKKAHSFRIAAGDKRLFFIEKTGLLQHKFLVRTEYSVIIGEIYPVHGWQSGIVSIDSKKINYKSKDGFLIVSSKKDEFAVALEVNNITQIDLEEFCALLFGTLRVLAKSFKTQASPVLA